MRRFYAKVFYADGVSETSYHVFDSKAARDAAVENFGEPGKMYPRMTPCRAKDVPQRIKDRRFCDDDIPEWTGCECPGYCDCYPNYLDYYHASKYERDSDAGDF